MSSARKGKTVIGICDEGNSLQVAKLHKYKDNISILATRIYKVDLSAETLEIPDDFEVLEVAIEDDTASVDITAEDEYEEVGLESTEEETVGNHSVYSEIQEMTRVKGCKFALSVSEPQVFYNIFESDWGLKGGKLIKRVINELSLIKDEYRFIKKDAVGITNFADGRLLTVIREQFPSFIEQLQINKKIFGRHPPAITFVESTELSIINLILYRYEPDESTFTIIVHVADEYSRFIFLKGSEIYHLPQVIGDGASSIDVATTLYSRLLLEMDTLDIPKVDNIIMTGMAEAAGVPEFFGDSFSFVDSVNDQINIQSMDFDNFDTVDFDKVENTDLVSCSAAIGAALRALHGEKANFHQIDILPNKIKEGQNRLMISPMGWIFLLMIPLLLFGSLMKIKELDWKAKQLKSNLISNRIQIEKYRTIEAEIETANIDLANYEKSFSLIDSLAVGGKAWSVFLEDLMRYNEEIKGLWFNSVTVLEDGIIQLDGFALYRNRIPWLVSKVNNARLKVVEVQEIREKTVYHFIIDIPTSAN